MKRSPLKRRMKLSAGRPDAEMKAWGARIRVRDRVCQMCGKGPEFDHALEAAHILGRQAHPALKYVDENGVLLGASCHRLFGEMPRAVRLAWVEQKWPGRSLQLVAIEIDRYKTTRELIEAITG